jgi:hypothetical protein
MKFSSFFTKIKNDFSLLLLLKLLPLISYGSFNRKEDFVPRAVQKPPQIQQRIYQRMNEAFMVKI